MKRVLVALAGVILSASLLTACDEGATKQSSPDPTSDQIQMVPPLQIIGMPQGFRNIAIVCDKFGNLWGVTSRGSDFAGGPNGGGLGSGLQIKADAPECKH